MTDATESPSPSSSSSPARIVQWVGVGLLLGVGVGWLLFASRRTADDEGTAGPAIWFADLGASAVLDDAVVDAILPALAAYLISEDGTSLVLPGALAEDADPRIVFLTLADESLRGRVVEGRGRGLAAALHDAAERARKLPIERGGELRVTLDIVEAVKPLSKLKPDGPVALRRGTEGLAFARETAAAFLPAEVLAYGLVSPKHRLRAGRVVNAMEATSRPHRVRVDSLLERGSSGGFAFTTRSVHWDGSAAIHLFRGHRLFEEVSGALLLDAAQAGGRYLARNVDANGRFVYAYWPSVDEEDEDYNILRHAGTTYSMLEVQEAAPDPALFSAAGRALSYLVRATEAGPEKGTAVVVEDGEVKLGGNGLAAIALSKYIQLTGDDAHKPLLLELGRWIESVQGEDGEFKVHKVFRATGHVFDFRSTYYPGEALLALARIYAVDPQAHWLDAAERGARWLIEVRDGGLDASELPHDHWLLYALNEIHAARPKAIYAEHAIRIVEAILAAQNLEPHRRDWLGSYYQPPRSTPTATRSEGLCAAWHLARRIGNEELATRIRAGIERGVRFQLQTQFRPESVVVLLDPKRVLGAFHRGLEDYEVRIDYVQHNVSAILGLRSILK